MRTLCATFNEEAKLCEICAYCNCFQSLVILLHIHMLLIFRKIGVPLVWRYVWDALKNRVLIQFKVSLADKAEKKKDECGA
eukprot:6205172-Pleurochrysis_carterae.AAC.3